MLMTPSAPTVGRPDVAPLPAELSTPSSTVPLGVFVPTASAAPLVLEPPPPPSKLPSTPFGERAPIPRLAGSKWRLTLDVAPVPMNVATAEAASTWPPPLVLPNGDPFLRMMDVSASAPHAGLVLWSVEQGWTGSDVVNLRCAVAGSAIDDTEARHRYAVGALNGGEDAVGQCL